jgi:hypothetical protein
MGIEKTWLLLILLDLSEGYNVNQTIFHLEDGWELFQASAVLADLLNVFRYHRTFCYESASVCLEFHLVLFSIGIMKSKDN